MTRISADIMPPHLISGSARLVGVMGDPVNHSLSPALHGYWLAKYGIDGAYVPLPVSNQHFEQVFRALPLMGFGGVNLTIPFKERVMDILDHVDEVADAIGAVNTVVFSEGKSFGTNTDGFGFRMALADALPRWERQISSALIIGAGGATCAILHELLAAGVAPIYLTNRTRERAEYLAARYPDVVRVLDWWDREKPLAHVDLVVNTTSLGMLHQLPLELDIRALRPQAVVMDVVYNPLETDLMREARQKACITVSGLGMLMHQARGGFERWFGVDPKIDDGLKVVLAKQFS
jgi:shikimate dehydrogenase